MPLELHCHTLFSPDARGTPEELVDIAAERGISTLAITEHNHFGSFARASKRAALHGVRVLSGIELNAMWQGAEYHFLAFGFDPRNSRLRDLADRNFALFEQHGWIFLSLLQQEGYPLDRAEVLAALPSRYPTHPAPILSSWHLREICLQQGYLPDKVSYLDLEKKLMKRAIAKEGPGIFGRCATFEEVRDAVCAAGGVLLLAHVALYRPGDLKGQLRVLSGLLENGLDGFELYHPANLAEEHFSRLADFAEDRRCRISGGSDCHHAAGAGGNPLGGVKVPDNILDSLDLALDRQP